MAAFIKVKVLSGLYSNFTNGGTQPAVNSFNYHIHTNPLNGSFASAFAHLDTLNLTEGYICNPAYPQYCQNGDLSGQSIFPLQLDPKNARRAKEDRRADLCFLPSSPLYLSSRQAWSVERDIDWKDSCFRLLG